MGTCTTRSDALVAAGQIRTEYRDGVKVNNRIELESYFPYLLRTISALIGQGTKTIHVDGHRIGMREWRILALIADQGAVTGKDIQYRSGMDKASISRSLKYMKNAGIITRTGSDGDWRSKPYEFTSEGARIYSDIAAAKIDRAERMWSKLSEAERRDLIALLQKLKDNVYSELFGSER